MASSSSRVTYQLLDDGFNQLPEGEVRIAVVNMLSKFGDNFGISFRLELMAFLHKVLFDLSIIGYDPIMNNNKICKFCCNSALITRHRFDRYSAGDGCSHLEGNRGWPNVCERFRNESHKTCPCRDRYLEDY